MCTQLCNHTKGVSLSHSSEKRKVARLLHVNDKKIIFAPGFCQVCNEIALLHGKFLLYVTIFVFTFYLLKEKK